MLAVNLEECLNCTESGWGWEDDGWGSSQPERRTVAFSRQRGLQRIRIQTREDGVSVDQVVLSAAQYLTTRARAAPETTRRSCRKPSSDRQACHVCARVRPHRVLPLRSRCTPDGRQSRKAWCLAQHSRGSARSGSATEFGAVARRLSRRKAETEFERGTRQFGYLLTAAMLVLALACSPCTRCAGVRPSRRCCFRWRWPWA